jgi:prepilin-type processing-associated H-X9-DG protein
MTTIKYPVNTKNFVESHMGYIQCNRPIQSAHPGGALVLFADGHVTMLSESTELQTFKDLANRDDGNVVALD